MSGANREFPPNHRIRPSQPDNSGCCHLASNNSKRRPNFREWRQLTMPNEGAIAAFRSSLRGELIEPGDSGYEAARKVYNAMIERRPRLIARCADVADVMAAVKFAREHRLLVAIRGGGHNAGGL